MLVKFGSLILYFMCIGDFIVLYGDNDWGESIWNGIKVYNDCEGINIWYFVLYSYWCIVFKELCSILMLV